jgi:hypothetical protein
MFNRKLIYLVLWIFIGTESALAAEYTKEERLNGLSQFFNTFREDDLQLIDSPLIELTLKYRPSPYKLPTEKENIFLNLVAAQFLESAGEESSNTVVKNITKQRLKWLNCILQLASYPPLQYEYNLQEEMWKNKIIPPEDSFQIDMVESLIKSQIEIEFLQRVLREFEYLSGYDGFLGLGTYDEIEDKSIEQRTIMTPVAECHSLIRERIKEKQSLVDGIKSHLKNTGILRSDEI